MPDAVTPTEVDPTAKADEWLELMWNEFGFKLTDSRLDKLEQGFASILAESDMEATAGTLTAQFALAGVQAMKVWRLKAKGG